METDKEGRLILPSEDSILKRRIQNSANWAALYIWLCECGRCNADHMIKIKASEIPKAIPSIERTVAYGMMGGLVNLKYFRKIPPNSRVSYYVNDGDFIYASLLETAETTLGKKQMDKIKKEVKK